MELPYDPAIPLLGICPGKTITGKDTCTPMFIAALFTIDKTWKQPKCPSRDEWIKKMCIYTMEYYSAIKKNGYDITYMWNLKYDTNEFTYKTETDSQTQKTNLWLPKGKGWRDKKIKPYIS